MLMGPQNWFQGMNSASLCSLAGRYDNPVPPRFLAPIDFLKSPGYAVLVEKVGLFLEKVGLFWIKPYFFSVGQVLVVWRKSRAFSKKALLFPRLPGFLKIRSIPSIILKAGHVSTHQWRYIHALALNRYRLCCFTSCLFMWSAGCDVCT